MLVNEMKRLHVRLGGYSFMRDDGTRIVLLARELQPRITAFSDHTVYVWSLNGACVSAQWTTAIKLNTSAIGADPSGWRSVCLKEPV